MALKGTLKDFGIADILQLIAQQQKTGTLVVTNKDQEVRIGFRDGSIVTTESTTRRKKDLIGEMLVRAELITPAELEKALEQQKRTLMRLGDVLVQNRALTAETFKRVVQRQSTETLYRLFHWKTGSYSFETEEVETFEDGMTPLRADGVLLEGFRILDEWPAVRKAIPSDELTFSLAEPLPPPTPKKESAEEDDFDSAFGGDDSPRAEFNSVGEPERRVHSLISPDRNVARLVDLSLLGEFETCKALTNLVKLGHLTVNAPKGRVRKAARLSLHSPGPSALGRTLAQVVLSVLVVGALGLVVLGLGNGVPGMRTSPGSSFSDPAAQRLVTHSQLDRIRTALEVYRLEKGALPEKLEGLVSAGLLTQSDLRYPWQDIYFYRRSSPTAFVLLPPLR